MIDMIDTELTSLINERDGIKQLKGLKELPGPFKLHACHYRFKVHLYQHEKVSELITSGRFSSRAALLREAIDDLLLKYDRELDE
jgi:hypothetical protein